MSESGEANRPAGCGSGAAAAATDWLRRDEIIVGGVLSKISPSGSHSRRQSPTLSSLLFFDRFAPCCDAHIRHADDVLKTARTKRAAEVMRDQSGSESVAHDTGVDVCLHFFHTFLASPNLRTHEVVITMLA